MLTAIIIAVLATLVVILTLTVHRQGQELDRAQRSNEYLRRSRCTSQPRTTTSRHDRWELT
jgi:hypothetical protein